MRKARMRRSRVDDGRMRPAEVLVRNLRGHPRDTAALLVWSLVEALPSLASGWSVAEALGQFTAGRAAGGVAWLGLMAAAALVGSFAARQVIIKLGALAEPLRDELVELVVHSALAESGGAGVPAEAATSRWIARITHQAEIVRDSWAGVVSVACTFGFTLGAAVAGLVTIAPATLPYVLPPLAVAVVAVRLLLRPFATRQRESVIAEEAVGDSVARAVSGVRDITACGGEEVVLAEVDGIIDRQAAATRAAVRAGTLRMFCETAGGWVPLLLMLAAAPALLRSGLSPEHVVGAITYIGGSARATLNTLSVGMGGSIVSLNVALERILSEANPGVPGAGRREPPEIARGHLQVRRVTFGYGPHAEPVIRDLSIDIPPGDHLAVVGPSGIGKSTLAALLAGMLQPDAGAILLDGTPVAAHGQRWRVLIPQEAYVFSGTLAENLMYYRAAAEQELDAATRAVGLTGVASRLGGYGGHVDPAALSAGERQLIALTRAYLSAAPVIILDEATCHLDPAAEQVAEDAFARRGGTLIVVAHRITSALRARRVLVLDGTRAHVGDHIKVLGDSVMYRDLVGYWARTEVTPAASGRG
jgi:ABC-type multidrug transport system fused ATPase/permease subunit